MTWNELYKKKEKELGYSEFDKFINSRKIRFKSNMPFKKKHIEELQVLISNHDIFNKSLLRRYEPYLTEEFKEKWLRKWLDRYSKSHMPEYQIYGILLPFYLINPETRIKLVDKLFLNDYLLLIIAGLDHKYRRFRWRANMILDFLSIGYSRLEPSMGYKIVELLSWKADSKNIRMINMVLFKNILFISPRILNEFVEKQLMKGIISPKMAIVYLKRFITLDSRLKKLLEDKILELKNGEKILKKMSPAPNNG